MLKGEPAREQCVVLDGVGFLNNADVDGKAMPPAGAPNIMMTAGGSQLKNVLEDDGVYAWRFAVDWKDASKTKVTGPDKIAVAPYHYLCDGQLKNCVPQRGTERRLDSQGDKIMSRLVYRRLGSRESIVGVHSVNTTAGGGGVRWLQVCGSIERETSRSTSRERTRPTGCSAGLGARRSTGLAISELAIPLADRHGLPVSGSPPVWRATLLVC